MPPAIILKTQFSTSKFKGYLKYINDEKAIKRIMIKRKFKV